MLRDGSLREAGRNLLAARQRSLLALLGIVVGTAAVVAMINLGTIVRQEALDRFLLLGTDIVAVSLQGGEEVAAFTPEEFERLRASVPGVAAAAPFAQGGAPLVVGGRRAGWIALTGVTEDFAALAGLSLEEGRFLSRFDGAEPFALLGRGRRAALAAEGHFLQAGEPLRLGDRPVRLVGFVAPAQTSPLVLADIDGGLLLSLAALRRLQPEAWPTRGLIRGAADNGPRAVAAAVAVFLQQGRPAGTLEVRSAEQLLAGMEGQMRLYRLLLGAFGGIALVLGGVGVMNAMLAAVAERRREIGIRLAVGATPAAIERLFLAEAVLLALLGGTLGSVLGLAGARGVAGAAAWHWTLEPWAVPIGAGTSALVGLASGLLPARRAARLDPVEALRAA